MSLSDWFRKQLELDAENAIELGEQERIIHVTGRHYIVLLGRLVGPVLLLVLFGGLALYRSVGGGLFVYDTGEPQGFDLLNYLLVGLIALMGAAWLILAVRGKKTTGSRRVLVVTAIPLGVLAMLRYGGWRVFYIDQTMFRDQGLDIWNIGLIILSLLDRKSVV